MERATRSAPRDRRTTGSRRRASPLETALHLGTSVAHVVALDAVSDAVLIADRDGVIVYTNPSCDALLGQRDGRLLGRRVYSLVTERATLLRPMLQALKREQAWHGRLRVRHASGRLVAIDATITPASQVEPAPSHFCVTARRADHSAHALGSVLEVIGRLAAETAHEFNNQIAVVLNYTFIMLRQLPESSPLREHLPQMQAAAWRASTVAQELLAFGGPRVLEPELIDVNEVLFGLDAVVGQALQGQTHLEARPSAGPLLVRARLPHIEWLLIELAIHAKRWLGHIERFEIATSIEEDAGTRLAVIEVIATPSRDGMLSGVLQHRGAGMPARLFPEDVRELPGVELALAHGQGTLSTTRNDDGAITYRFKMPSAKP